MSAGTGVTHSEMNAETHRERSFQIWIQPREVGGTPRWGNRAFPKSDRAGHFVVLASGYSDEDTALPIRANARVLGATLLAGQNLSYGFRPHRMGYLVSPTGNILINGAELLEASDGAAIAREAQIRIEAVTDSELVLVDVA
jgi:quercetin 2,3-dioxygenase